MLIIIILLKIKSSQHNELKNVRRNLDKYFPTIRGFLLPHPGKAIVTNQAYNGLVKGNIRWIVSHNIRVPFFVKKSRQKDFQAKET